MNSSNWITSVIKCFDPQGKLIVEEDMSLVEEDISLVDNEMSMKQENILANMLTHRLTRHLNRRLKDSPAKKTYWVVGWVQKNVSIVAAMMIFFKMIKKDISCLDDSETLLNGPESFANAEKDLQGVYLYYDANDRVWIRSGKVTDKARERNFEIRHKEHTQKAQARQLISNTSRFYIAYPSNESPRSNSKAKRGIFETLQIYKGFGFDQSAGAVTTLLTTDISDGGIFTFSKEDKANIMSINFRGKENWSEKAVEMIAYLLELMLDISIAPKDNISSSPGFEVIFGVVV